MFRKVQEKIRHRLSVHVFGYFVLILFIFTGLMAMVFIKLYESNTASSYTTLLSAQGERIADRISKYSYTENIDEYSVYMETLQDDGKSDVWIISNKEAEHPLKEEFEINGFTKEEMPSMLAKVLKSVFSGEIGSETGFSDIYDEKVTMVGTPIYRDGEDETIGAVIVVSLMETQDEEIKTIVVLFAISLIFSMIVSFLLAIMFAKRLSTPISSISKSALKLADGDYKTRTEIDQLDEIGQLARSMNKLAYQLEQNEIQQNNNEQMRRDFFSNISHELRTPITVIRAYLETLVDGVVTEQQKIEQYHKRMLTECSGMERLIQDLLVLSKMENPDFKIEKEPIELVQIFEDIIRNTKLLRETKKIKIKFSKNDDCCMMNGDYDRIRQMFMAVLDNAIKFSSFESTIYINIDASDKLVIEIRDEGIGMTEEEKEQIFLKFYTKKSGNNKNGSGLGLVIAKTIAYRHNGTIEVVSEKGKGTSFIFQFERIHMLNEEE